MLLCEVGNKPIKIGKRGTQVYTPTGAEAEWEDPEKTVFFTVDGKKFKITFDFMSYDEDALAKFDEDDIPSQTKLEVGITFSQYQDRTEEIKVKKSDYKLFKQLRNFARKEGDVEEEKRYQQHVTIIEGDLGKLINIHATWSHDILGNISDPIKVFSTIGNEIVKVIKETRKKMPYSEFSLRFSGANPNRDVNRVRLYQRLVKRLVSLFPGANVDEEPNESSDDKPWIESMRWDITIPKLSEKPKKSSKDMLPHSNRDRSHGGMDTWYDEDLPYPQKHKEGRWT